ncbi:MAG: peptidylprolyl isomerase [Ectothiorhodospira sp.]
MKTLTSLLFLLCLLWGSAVPASETAQPLDRIVAVAEDDVITQRQLLARVRTVQRLTEAREDQDRPRDELMRPVLERLVMERLQLQEADRMGIRVDDIRLNNAMEDIARENGLSLAAFRDRLVDDGIDFADFREQIRNEMTLSQLHQRRVDSRIHVSQQEIDEFLASESGRIDDGMEYHLRHLLISTPEEADSEAIEAARRRAEALREEVSSGADFTELVVRASEGHNALEGGDLGWRPAGEVPTLFARHVVTMREGEVSPVIRSASGFHLVQLVERRGGEGTQVRQTRVSHILITPNEIVGDEEARQRLVSLRERIAGGTDFAELARAHSDDRGSALEGGDLGWVNPGEMSPGFEEVMNETPPGEISQPFSTRFGWHVLKVHERRTHDSSRERMQARARRMIHERKREEQLELWLRRLRDESYVEYRLDAEQDQDEANGGKG